jgi:hypothetical protein
VRNYDQKTKDMIESVLPSTARLTARRMRRQIHSSRRMRETQALRRHWQTGRLDDYALVDGYFLSDVSYLIWTRRAWDKVGPLTRWAVRRVLADPDLRAAPLADQVNHFRGMLPDNTVGRHALQHIESTLRWKLRAGDWSSAAQRGAADAAAQERIATMTAQTHRILAAGRHAELNHRLKRLLAREAAAGRRPDWQFVPAPHRLLAGAHDVKDFVRETHASTAVPALLRELSG